MNRSQFLRNRWRADRLNLRGAWRLFADTEKALAICNGIGAEWMPAWMRTAITAINPTLTPASMIHDLEYANGGNFYDRLKADYRFLENGFISANYYYHWYSPCRYIVWWQAIKFFVLLRIFGGAAFSTEDK